MVRPFKSLFKKKKYKYKTGPSNIQSDTFERMSTVSIDDKAWIMNILKIENKIPSGSMTDSKEIWFVNPPRILILIKSAFGMRAATFNIWKKFTPMF